MERTQAVKNLNELYGRLGAYYSDGFYKQDNIDLEYAGDERLSVNEETVDDTEFITINKRKQIIELAEKVISCKSCDLGCGSNIRIPGTGNPAAKVFVLCSPPVQSDIESQRPLSGAVEDFTGKWFSSIGLRYDELFVTNIVKCIPSQKITIPHIEKCFDHLQKQINIVAPLLIVTLGQVAISSLLKKQFNLELNHGELVYFNNIPVFPVFDPHIVFKTPSLKKPVWDDLKKIRNFMDGL